LKTYKIHITGVVQGVGFRPFLHKIAKENKILGYAFNYTGGVIVEIQGDEKAKRKFIDDIKEKKPPLAQINSLSFTECDLKTIFSDFEIRLSQAAAEGASEKVPALLPPDMAVCEDCQKEMSLSSDKRSFYPFINCTNCGPRYTILNRLPYDRKNTSMAEFAMCSRCNKEYTDILDRRYHAEPTCCPECGPQVLLKDKNDKTIGLSQEAINHFVLKIKEGCILALKGIGGFHLLCDASNNDAVKKLRARKKRSDKPFAVMFPSIEVLKEHLVINETEESFILSRQRPIVILKKNQKSNLAQNISPGSDTIGAFLPYSPLHILILDKFNDPIVATSANISEEPIIKDYELLKTRLNGVFDYALDHNRKILHGCDDSVMRVSEKIPIVMRRARGMAPGFFHLPRKLQNNVLAVGAQQKNTITFGIEDKVIMTPHIGDLGSYFADNFFKDNYNALKNIYSFEPDLIVCDKHPRYFTTEWAQTQNIPMVSVQHHYAHALSLMLENNIKEDETLFCAVFDGTGYGDDENIWGGEFLNCSYKDFTRETYFHYFRLLGGEKAVKEPRRVALSLLFQLYEEKSLQMPEIQKFNFSENEIAALYSMFQKGINSPLSSSAGRLFDAAASLMNLRQNISYEGESGLLIEDLYDYKDESSFQYHIDKGIISWQGIVEGLIEIKDEKKAATMFINTLAQIIVELAKPYEKFGISGGVFQNSALVWRINKLAEKHRLKLFTHIHYPPNDGGISLGQIASRLYSH